jgi:hypothetical protein
LHSDTVINVIYIFPEKRFNNGAEEAHEDALIDARFPNNGAHVEGFHGTQQEWRNTGQLDRLEHRATYANRMDRYIAAHSYTGMVTGFATKREVQALNAKVDRLHVKMDTVIVCL